MPQLPVAATLERLDLRRAVLDHPTAKESDELLAGLTHFSICTNRLIVSLIWRAGRKAAGFGLGALAPTRSLAKPDTMAHPRRD